MQWTTDGSDSLLTHTLTHTTHTHTHTSGLFVGTHTVGGGLVCGKIISYLLDSKVATFGA